jgi:hypothetical protein
MPVYRRKAFTSTDDVEFRIGNEFYRLAALRSKLQDIAHGFVHLLRAFLAFRSFVQGNFNVEI